MLILMKDDFESKEVGLFFKYYNVFVFVYFFLLLIRSSVCLFLIKIILKFYFRFVKILKVCLFFFFDKSFRFFLVFFFIIFIFIKMFLDLKLISFLFVYIFIKWCVYFFVIL